MTRVTIELTDEMVTALRAWVREPTPPGQSSFRIDTVVATLAANELPPPPRTVPVTLPGEVAEVLAKLDPTYPGLLGRLETDGQIDEALRALVRSLQANR